MNRPLLEAPTVASSGKNVGGRPRKQPPAYAPIAIRETPPQDIAQQIEKMAALGRNKIYIASQLGTTDQVLNRWLSEDPMLDWVFKRGRSRYEAELVDILTADARDRAKPNVNVFFLLKNMFGWREGETTDPGSRVYVTVNMPGAMSREEWTKSVVASDG